MRIIILGSCLTSFLMGWVLFNCNRVFSEFGYCYSRSAPIIFLKYFFIILFYFLI